ncbi:MAG: AAA family ATPase [Saprospiraceae bacterium]|nr:AAA family ATPase [Saprospiraceae bacterium]
MPNKFGVNTEHFAQTLLYHLMIESVYQNTHSIQAYVLYSSQSTQSLRKTAMEPGMKEKLIDLRNALIAMHLHMAFHPKSENFILDQLGIQHFAHAESYTKRDAILLLSIYQTLLPHEKDYFKEFTGFIAREQLISKTGRAQSQYIEGLASLWLLSVTEKRKQHMLLSGLRMIEIVSDPQDYPILILEETETEVHLANFRIGDTLVLYRQASALQEQIFKATLIDIQSGKYWIRLRTRQFPEKLRSADANWNIEHDFLDRSFLYQYQNLCDWAKSSPHKRNLLLGIQKPESLKNDIYDLHPETPQAIRPILQKILNAKEYYLVWGPPGSGKTSMVIRFLADALIHKCNENILLLAYTNRAVDEICEVLDWIKKDSGTDYIRIGSRYGVQEKFKTQLLDEKIKSLKGRADTLELIRSTPIFVATIASMQGKKELFELKSFDTVIVDEASQILEVQMVGLLTKFKRFILIGDHMQLPAVSAQTELESKIKADSLRKLMITQLNMSFFERLYLQCKSQHWVDAFTMLELQGRMHQEIMEYPAKMFYEGQLSILPDGLNARQKRNYEDLFKLKSTEFQKLLSKHRTLFVPSNFSENIIGSKTNFLEAELVAKLVQAIYNLYRDNGLNWNEMSLGVITPFRAQIALIKQQLHAHVLPVANQITVDTAERYQGGARDIIILSTVITDASQLTQISSITEQGADRKLNVALTRAKEQIILVGNPDALTESQHYRNLINDYTFLDPNLVQIP